MERQLGLENKSEYDLFALVPLRSDKKADLLLFESIKKHSCPEIAIRLNDSSK